MASDALLPIGWSENRLQRIRIATALSAAVLFGLCAFLWPTAALRSYLFGYICVLSIPLGSLVLLMLQHVTGGAWGVIIRRPLEAATRTMPLMAVLFLPIAFGVRHLYPWAAEGVHLPNPKGIYLSVPFFWIRAVIYFVVWIGLAWVLSKWSAQHDRMNTTGLDRRFRLLAAPGLGLYGLTITFASIDWVMSLEPNWFSSIYGVAFGVGQMITAMAVAILTVAKFSDRPPYRRFLVSGHLRDLGSLTLAFVMVWAYLNVSQLILIWSANIQEEVPYYLARSHGIWLPLSVLMVGLQFLLPFLVLLTRDGKRNLRALSFVAWMILAARVIEYLWLIAPGRPIDGQTLFVSDPLALLALVPIWEFLYYRELDRVPLLPVNVDASVQGDHHG